MKIDPVAWAILQVLESMIENSNGRQAKFHLRQIAIHVKLLGVLLHQETKTA